MILGLSEPQTYLFNKYFPEIYSVSGPVSGPRNKPVNKKLWTVQSREQGEIHNKERNPVDGDSDKYFRENTKGHVYHESQGSW